MGGAVDEGDFVVLPTTESFVATATMWRELQDELQELHLLNEALMEQVQVDHTRNKPRPL